MSPKLSNSIEDILFNLKNWYLLGENTNTIATEVFWNSHKRKFHHQN